MFDLISTEKGANDVLGNFKAPELILLLLVVVVLFGAKRLPDAARGLGRSLRIFKAETKALTEDGAAASTVTAEVPEIPAQVQSVQQQVAAQQIAPTHDAPPIGSPVNVTPPASQPRA